MFGYHRVIVIPWNNDRHGRAAAAREPRPLCEFAAANVGCRGEDLAGGPMTPVPTRTEKPALKARLLYVIEPGDLCKLAQIEDSLIAPAYGRTVVERNLRLLRKRFRHIHVVLLVKEAFADALHGAVGRISADGNLTVQVVTSLSDYQPTDDEI